MINTSIVAKSALMWIHRSQTVIQRRLVKVVVDRYVYGVQRVVTGVVYSVANPCIQRMIGTLAIYSSDGIVVRDNF